MKILHTSDLHLNSKMNSRLGTAEARNRKRELLESFAEMVSYARAEGIEAFIIAGDLFDTERISEKVKRSVLDIILSAPEISFLYLTGNHEREAFKDGISLAENILSFEEGWTYHRFGNVKIAGRETTDEDMFLGIERPRGDEVLIAVLHGELRDYSRAGGIIGARELEGSGISYLALGHYHSYMEKRISRDCVAVYSGTPAGRGFDEAGEKGFVVIDIEGKNVNYSFHKTSSRRFSIVEIPLDGVMTGRELEEKISHGCRDIDKTGLLRVKLTGHRSPDATFDTEAIKRRLEGGYYFLEIRDESRLEINPEDYKGDMTLKGEFIRTVYSDPRLTEEEKEEIVLTGIRALMGERFDEI